MRILQAFWGGCVCVCVQGEREKREEGDGGFKNMTYYTIGFFFSHMDGICCAKY